jgi:hypothetical protein
MQTLYPQSAMSVLVYRHGSDTPLDLSNEITSFHAHKLMASDRGDATLSLKLPPRWPSIMDIVSDDDWLIVKLRGFGNEKPGLYFIDQIREDESVLANGAIVRTAEIALTDCAKPLVTHEFRLWTGLSVPHVPGMLVADDELTGIALGSSEQRPTDVIRAIIKRAFRPTAVSISSRKELRPVDPKPVAKKKASASVNNSEIAPGFKTADFLVGIKATPPPDVQANLATLAGYLHALQVSVFEGRKITVIRGGGWEPPTPTGTNRKQTSRHRLGQAVDIRVEGLASEEVAKLIQQAISAGTVPWGGLGLYSEFVHYDIGTGENRPAQWVGQNSKAPNEAQLAAVGGLAAWKTWRPSSSSAIAASAEDEEQEAPEELFEEVEVLQATFAPGQSGEGAFVVPQSLASAITAGGSVVGRYDWLDVLDVVSWMDRPTPVKGAWWKLGALLSQRSSVDQLARSGVDTTFVEWWCDVLPVVAQRSVLTKALGGLAPCLVFRRRPFDASAWQQLPTWELQKAHVRSIRRTKSGAERGTMHYVQSSSLSLLADAYTDGAITGGRGTVPAINAARARIHGLRCVEAQSHFAFAVGTSDEEKKRFTEYIREENEAFYRWNAPLPDMQRAEIEMPFFSPNAKIGTRLRLVANDGITEEGYIVGVSETFQVDPRSGARRASTTLTVERLHRPPMPQPEPQSWRNDVVV